MMGELHPATPLRCKVAPVQSLGDLCHLSADCALPHLQGFLQELELIVVLIIFQNLS
jgi:hypothetical protein